MGRVVAAVLAVAGLALAAPAAAGGEESTEERLDRVLRELESQRREIEDLKSRLAERETAPRSAVEAEVKRYLESEEGRKALGRGPRDLRVSWKEGLRFETEDRSFSLRVGGRLQFDVLADASADRDLETAAGEFNTGVMVRRARIEFSGTIHERVFYSSQFEFGGGTFAFQDSAIGYRGIPWLGTFQVGHFKEPFSLEEMTSDKYITFMERGLPNAFSPSYHTGFQVSDEVLDGRATWAAGSFSDTGTGSGGGRLGNSMTARVTGAPVLEKETATVVHLGASLQDRRPKNETLSLSARPEARGAPTVARTGSFSAETADVIGLEAAVVRGPLSVQAEWMQWDSRHDSGAGPGEDPTFRGWYAFASWFLTGESRPYRGGSFGRVIPKSDFDGKSGTGAVELAVRWSALDLTDGAIRGGEVENLTLGVNWYLNPSTRVMVNWVRSDVRGLGDARIVELRFAVDF